MIIKYGITICRSVLCFTIYKETSDPYTSLTNLPASVVEILAHGNAMQILCSKPLLETFTH